mgnify:CR=1 FL=1
MARASPGTLWWVITRFWAASHWFTSFVEWVLTALKDVAPYVIVAGNPAKSYGVNVRGLRRRGFGEDQIVELKKTYKEVFRNTARTNTESISCNKASPGSSPSAQLLTFAGESRRGLIR